MILDAQLMFSDAQAITADAASTNIIDLGSVRQIAVGTPMAVLVGGDVSADITTTDETYSVNIQTDDNAAFSSPTTVSTNVITAANLAAGAKHIISVPQAGMERYMRVYYDVGGTTPTVTLTAFLAPLDFIGNNGLYADAITIS